MCAGIDFMCAITADARVKCWGNCNLGQCGSEATETLGDEPGEMGDALLPVNLGSPQPEVTSLACTGYTACALSSDGTVRCWGRAAPEGYKGNFELTVANGHAINTMGAVLPPMQLPTGRKATSVSCGHSHCCVILDDGSALCYGSGSSGQLGYSGSPTYVGFARPATADEAGLVDLPPGRTAVKIACGGGHTCAILDEGSVVCWGQGAYGRLGNGGRLSVTGGVNVCNVLNDGTCGVNLTPVNLGSGRRAVDIAAGSDWTCAVLDDGGVHCWGYNSGGVLGYDLHKFDYLGDEPLEPGGVTDPIYFPGGKAVKIYGMQSGRCAILDVGDVVCWGKAGNGAIPNAQGADWYDWYNPSHWSLQDDYPPIDLGGRKAFALAAGGGSNNVFQCAMLSAADCDVCRDEIRCWGANYNGQLGYGDTRNRGVVDGDFARDVVDLGAVGVHPAFQVWDYLRDAEPTPPDPTETLTVSQVHTCAILALGRVLCWGRSGYGALGGFQTNSRNFPDPSKGVPVFFGYDERNGPSRDKTFFAKSISACDKSTCAILEDDSLACWGQNYHHSLGIGGSIEARGIAESMLALAPNGIDWRVPVLDRGGDAAKVVDNCQGIYFGCAATSEGDVWCWGQDLNGKLGLGTNSNPTNEPPDNQIGSPPTRVDLGADENGAPLRAVSLSCAAHAVCAAFDDGRVKCWGRNDYGQLGRGTNSLIEKSYVGNAAGEMGDALPFLYLGDGKRALKLSAGLEHFCAVLDTHELKCWGRNNMGAVGAGSSAARTLADLDGLPYDEQDTIVDLGTDAFCRPLRVVDIATMRYSTCALLESGRVKCFGENADGRLGLGDTQHRGDAAGEMGDELDFVNLGDDEVWRVKRLARSSAHAESMCAVLVPVESDLAAASGAEPERVKCWGDNTYGSLGYGHTGDLGTTPGHMGDNLPFVDFASWARPAESGWTLASAPAPSIDPLPEWVPAEAPVVPTLDFSSLAVWNASVELFEGDDTSWFDSVGLTSSETYPLPAWAVGAPGTMKTNKDGAQTRVSFTTSHPAVARALVPRSLATSMTDHALYVEKPALLFVAEWLDVGGETEVMVKDRLFPAGSHELLVKAREFYLFFAPDPAIPACYPQPTNLPRAFKTDAPRVDFLGKGGAVPWLQERDSPLLWTGARPLPDWSEGALGLTFDAYSRARASSDVDEEYFHAVNDVVVRVVMRSKLSLDDLGNWTRRSDLDWTGEDGFEPNNEVYERLFPAGTHALDVRASYHVSDNFWYQFVPADVN